MPFETLEEANTAFEAEQKAKTEVEGKLKGYQEKLGDVENLESFTELKTQRDSLKAKAAKVSDLEKEIANLKKGSGKDEDKAKLLEDKEKELEEINGKLTAAEQRAKRADELEADIVKELTDQLPDEHKPIVEGMEIPKLRAYVKLHGTKPPPSAHNGSANGGEVKLTEAQKKEKERMGIASDKLYLEVLESKNKKKEEINL